MRNKKEDVLALISNIWDLVYPIYEPFSRELIGLLRIKRDNIIAGNHKYSFGYLHSLLTCIKYSISEKSSTHQYLAKYVDELDKMDKRTFEKWLVKLTSS